MRVLDATPAQDGFFMPAEFSPHYGCILIFPERSDSWQYGAYAARKAFVQVCTAIAKSEKVTVCASGRQYENARRMLPPHIRVVEMSSNDSWARDYAPTFVTNGRIIRGVNWSFNAWGGLVDGLYFPWDKDDRMARKLCDLFDKSMYDASGFVLEGGSIHSDGEGTILTTEACLLSAGRNPDLTKEQIEDKLKEYLGAQKVIWLKRGIYNDETNEHVDNICAFVKPGEAVLAWTDDTSDPQYELSRSCLEILESSTDARGRQIKVHKLYLPKPVTITAEECGGLDTMDFQPTRTPGERLAASYVNFYISNGAVVMPFFNDPADEPARAKLQELFPEREVIPVYARDILIGGGNIHCITQQIPAFTEEESQAGVTATCGKTCCGKSHYARELQRTAGGVILSCDELTLMLPEVSHDTLLPLVKQYLLKKSVEITAAGADVILDWGLWTRAERDELRSFYRSRGIPFRIVYLEVSDEQRRGFISRRNAEVAAGQVSAYIIDEGLERKLNSLFEPPSPDEIIDKV